MEDETAGDPMTGMKWTRRTTEKISDQLKMIGINVSRNTVGRLLKELDFSLKVNHKKLSKGTKTTRIMRNQQFIALGDVRKKFVALGNPVISVDTKKKELIGNFKNPGQTWRQKAREVNDHDFKSDSDGKCVPYGIYDCISNRGCIVLGNSSDTGEFAVDSIEKWWLSEGKKKYRGGKEILILADAGGSNSYRSRLWKFELQRSLCNIHGLTVTVNHYPPGASKWNPIEHRLFSEISKNWAGIPLDSVETALKYIRTTKTKTGLKVSAHLKLGTYEKGIKVTDQQMAELNIKPHEILPQWNYTIRPNKM